MTDGAATPYTVVVEFSGAGMTTLGQGFLATSHPSGPQAETSEQAAAGRSSGAPEPDDVIAPMAHYSTLNRSHHAVPEPRAARRRLGSDSAPPRNGGRQRSSAQGFSPASHRPSRR